MSLEKTRAAVLVKLNEPVQVMDLKLPELKAGQSLVEIHYSGVCFTQVSECKGYKGEDKFLPHCLGHEGSGVVLETGPGVTKVKKGDRVVLSWIKGSGADVPSTQYKNIEQVVNSGALATFSEHAVVSENRLTVVPAAVALKDAALVGCAIPTGIGAVKNTLQAQVGQSIAVFGVGGVGLSSVVGAVLAGCTPIVAIDLMDDKLAMAKKLGATHTFNPKSCDIVAELKKLVPKGFDLAVEATGNPKVIADSVEILRNQGGKTVVIGNPKNEDVLTISPKVFNQGKSILGTWGGDTKPDVDYPYYFEMIAQGKIALTSIFTKTYKLGEINQAIDDLATGKCIRPLVQLR